MRVYVPFLNIPFEESILEGLQYNCYSVYSEKEGNEFFLGYLSANGLVGEKPGNEDNLKVGMPSQWINLSEILGIGEFNIEIRALPNSYSFIIAEVAETVSLIC